MAEPTTNIRHLIKKAFISALRQKLRGVQVEYYWPGEAIENEAVWAESCTGSTEVPTMKSGRLHRQDDFTLTVVFRVGPAGQNAETNEARLMELVGALDDVMSEDHTLKGLGGLQDFGAEAQYDGPDSFMTPNGVVSVLVADIAINSRYQ